MSFPARIKILRKALHLTQREFAKALHISGSYVSEIEAGKKIPSESLMDFIMARWDVASDWWEDGTGEMFNKKADTVAAALNTVVVASMADSGFINLPVEQQIAFFYQKMRELGGDPDAGTK